MSHYYKIWEINSHKNFGYQTFSINKTQDLILVINYKKYWHILKKKKRRCEKKAPIFKHFIII